MTGLGLCEMTFSEKLKLLLEESGYTLKVLSAKTGIGVPTIKSYTRGIREPSFSNAVRIAKAFGKALEYFEDADEVTARKPTKRKKGK